MYCLLTQHFEILALANLALLTISKLALLMIAHLAIMQTTPFQISPCYFALVNVCLLGTMHTGGWHLVHDSRQCVCVQAHCLQHPSSTLEIANMCDQAALLDPEMSV